MLPLWAALMAAGVAKSELIDRPKEKRQRTLAAETQRNSPWTGMQANDVQEADPFGSALQGGAMGLTMGQSMDNADQAKELQKAQVNNLNEQGNLYKTLNDQQAERAKVVGPRRSDNPTLSYWANLMNQGQ